MQNKQHSSGTTMNATSAARAATLRNRLFGTAAALGGALFSAISAADWKMNLQTPNSAVAEQMFGLHTLITVICAVIFIAVFGVMFYSLYKHRKSVGHKAANFHENATVEVIWTVIPFLILLVMAWPATKAVLDMRDTTAPEMTIKVTGYQWKWGYDYIHDGFGYVSTLATPLAQIKGNEAKGEHYLLEVDNPLVVPAGKKVRVLITANDVLHAWWVPALGVKQDAIPGFIRDAWFRADRPGIYRGNCAELCGKEHGYMPIVVEVKSQADYDVWLKAQKEKYGVGKAAAAAPIDTKTYARDDLVAHGKTVYEGSGGCQGCHQANGKGGGAFPALDGSKLVNGPKADQIDILLNGSKKNSAMAAFKHLSDKDLAGVMAYTRSSWSNKAAEIAQPIDFAKARNGGVLPAGVTADAGAAAPAPAASAVAATDSNLLPAKIYFDTGKKELPGDVKESLNAALAFLKVKSDNKVAITGYTDKTGNQVANLELAKERAKAVRAALEAAGVAKDRIIMKKPEETTGSSDNKEARRVEINVGT
jgi:cytochrome c oxidase subunit II